MTDTRQQSAVADTSKALRKAWQLANELLPDLWARFYTLAWILNAIPSSDDEEFRNTCLNHLFDLLKQMSNNEKAQGLLLLTWKLPAVDQNAAIRAYEELFASFPSINDPVHFNLAAEEFASIDLERAIALTKRLENYPLSFTSLTKIAAELADSQPEKALEFMLDARRSIINSEEPPSAKAASIIDLQKSASDYAPLEMRKALLADAHLLCKNIQETFYKVSSLLELAEAAIDIAPQIASEACHDATLAAYALETEEPAGWFDFSGPGPSAAGLAEVARVITTMDPPASREIIEKVLVLCNKIESPYDQLPVLLSLARATGELKQNENTAIAVELWQRLRLCVEKGSTSSDAKYMFRDLELQIESFVKMNESVAALSVDEFLDKCKTIAPPEQVVLWICKLAVLLGPHSLQHAETMLAQAKGIASSCSSKYIQTTALASLVSAMQILELDNQACLGELRKNSEQVLAPLTRYALLIELAEIMEVSNPELALQFASEALAVADKLATNPIDALAELRDKAPILFSDLYLYWIERGKEKTADQLCQWSNRYAT